MDVTGATLSATISLVANTKKEQIISANFPRGFGWETPLKINIKNNSATAITDLYIYYFNNSGVEVFCRFNGSGFSLAQNKTLVIDASDYSVKIDSVNWMKALVQGDLPCAYPTNPSTALNFKASTAASVTLDVQTRARWV